MDPRLHERDDSVGTIPDLVMEVPVGGWSDLMGWANLCWDQSFMFRYQCPCLVRGWYTLTATRESASRWRGT